MIKTAKISLAALITVLFAFNANAIEVRVGVSAAYAQLEASGTETLKDTSGVTSHTEQANAVIPSLFGEFAMDNGFGIGYDLISGSADLAGSVRSRTLDGNDSQDSGTNKANAEVDGVSTLYLIKMFGNGLYIKAGLSEADVNTLETLSSGSTYGNKSVDGQMYGIGFERANDSGIFIRAGVEYTDFDTLNLTSGVADAVTATTNTIKADVDVVMAKFSIGKSF